MWSHNNSKWDQFKVRDIIVGYVRAPKVRFERDRYDMYYTSIPSSSFEPGLNFDNYNGDVGYKVDNNDIATVNADGVLKFKRPGTVVLTATCHASENCAKAQCSTTVSVKRDGVTFTSVGLPDVLFSNTPHNLRDYLYNSKTKSGENFDYNNGSFSITSSNNAVLRYDDRWLKFGGTAGEATITFTQKETNFYEAASLSHTIIVARRDQYGTILIKDANEWKVFCKLVNEKGMTNLNARLEADVNLGGDIAMIGRYDHKYAGTFDGQNHTLTLNWNTSESDIAPFRRVGGATIKNLRTAGTIKSSGHFLAGLIDEVYGDNNTISNCVSAVNITSSYTSDRCGAGGLISYIYTNTQVTITDCLVKGSINGTGAGRKGMGGFVCYQYGTCTLTNCLYAGTNNGSNEYSYTFAPNATLNNCYYLNACGSEYKQGTKVTEEQLRSGAVAWMLQKGRSDMAWGQKIGRDDAPQLTRDNDKRICKVTFAYNGREEATRYANKGGTVASMPTFTPKDLLGSDYNEHHYYSGIAFEDGFNGSTTVNTDRTVALTFNKKDYYEIATKEDWKAFCDIVKSGQNAVDAKLTRNVDLGSEINMVGNDNNKYSGTFDGQNHTLKLDWSNTNGVLAPFYKVENATIRNLRTEGNIKSSYSLLSGLILVVSGKTTITNCVSNVNITSSRKSGSCDMAGMILEIPYGAVVTFTDCIVKGKFNKTFEEVHFYVSGFVTNHNGTSTFNNCLYLGDNVPGGGYTFAAYTYLGPTLNNCYYLNACGVAQGTQVTADQLKFGEVTYKLQNGRNMQFWGQNLDTDNEPQLTADAAKHVYEVKFTYNNKVAATRYANSGKAIAGGMPTAQDILGTLYDPAKKYTLIFEYGFNTVTDVYEDRTVAVSILANNNFDIATKDDWKEFRELVHDGHSNLDAKMTADVDLDRNIVLVGNDIVKYSGTFDGQGHTLTVNWNRTGYSIAPFGGVNGATIKNLHVKGQITASGGNLSGLILFADGGKTSVSGCVIDMDFKGSSDVSGMIYKVYGGAQVSITDCVVKGALNSTSTGQIAGFVNYQDYNSSCTLTNCLYAGTNNATPGSYTFANRANLNNCYYLNACGEAQGEQVTEEQLKNGYVAHKLQAGRTDKCYWAQVLGEMPSPYRETGKAETNYVYYNKENNRWACDDFRLADGKPLPIGIDFIATKATYERDLSIGKATLCLPYELSVQGFKAYTISGGNGSAVYFAEAKDKLEAYKPYLITVDGVPQFGGENIEVQAFNDDKLTTPAGKYKFVGTVTGVDNATAAAANAYILQEDGKFHKVTTEHSEAMLPAYRAYIQRNDSGAKQLSIVIDGETTGIGGTTDGMTVTDGAVYDLQGRRVADRLDDDARHRLPAGVYIVGGRKIILK